MWGLLGPIVATGLTCGWWQELGSGSGSSPHFQQAHLAKKWLGEAVLALAHHWVALALTWSSKSFAKMLPCPLFLSFIVCLLTKETSSVSFPFFSGSVASTLVTPQSQGE